MSSSKSHVFKEVIPKAGQLYQEDHPSIVLCKPKIMPLKSITLEKMEKMQADSQEAMKKHETEASNSQF
ncbi:BBSome-interacting protein 1-like [Clavelina lepadiformis]|uniref:BBSome-interacting protein 1-like n=1 Tax=Clavelina lepadiformis TaxID=159417 RepID=UPI00404376F2